MIVHHHIQTGCTEDKSTIDNTPSINKEAVSWTTNPADALHYESVNMVIHSKHIQEAIIMQQKHGEKMVQWSRPDFKCRKVNYKLVSWDLVIISVVVLDIIGVIYSLRKLLHSMIA